jgi:glycine/D-amino acid oxidase-like deaminating enzyme
MCPRFHWQRRAALRDYSARFEDDVLHGVFAVAGLAFAAKTLCVRLTGWLERRGVDFEWGRRIERELDQQLNSARDRIVWCGGVSGGPVQMFKRNGVLLQGVAGCWMDIPNVGFDRPFKLFGPEPINYINATPLGSRLLVSGGYGWIGERPYSQACRLTGPLAAEFRRVVGRLFGGSPCTFEQEAVALCIRPTLPSGVPLIGRLDDEQVYMNVGHAAGGFTQAPAAARMVLNKIDGD